MRFENKRVVITGGAGGIGLTLVELFSREGAKIVFSDRSESACAEIQHTLQQKGMETHSL